MDEKKNKDMNDELEKLEEKETDDVSGGKLFKGEDYEDGHEINCIIAYHRENECPESPDGYHFWVLTRCKRCGKELLNVN